MSTLSIFSKQVAELNPQPIYAVLFDLDGTLIDSVPDLAAAIDVMLESVGKAPVGEVKVNRWVGNGAAALVKRALADRDDGDERHHARYPSEHEDEEYASAYSIFECAYAQRLTTGTGLYDGVLSVLSALVSVDIKLGLITNKPRRFTVPLLKALGIDHYFAEVLCGDDLEFKKPHPLPVLTALKNLSVSAQQAIMVGDSISDIKSASAAGVKTVAVTYGYNHGIPITDARNECQADMTIDKIKQLLN
ncbi:MAG: phosphoglycolate phosphatase [Oleispira sp.]|jgi:phosphoglycolate phosphatase